MAEFKFCALPPASTPEGFLIFVEHRTPDLVRPPATLRHANTADALVDVLVCTDRADETLARYERYTGRPAAASGPGLWTIALDAQTLRICNPDWLTRTHGVDPPAATCIAGISLHVRDLGAAQRVLRDAVQPVHERMIDISGSSMNHWAPGEARKPSPKGDLADSLASRFLISITRHETGDGVRVDLMSDLGFVLVLRA